MLVAKSTVTCEYSVILPYMYTPQPISGMEIARTYLRIMNSSYSKSFVCMHSKQIVWSHLKSTMYCAINYGPRLVRSKNVNLGIPKQLTSVYLWGPQGCTGRIGAAPMLCLHHATEPDDEPFCFAIPSIALFIYCNFIWVPFKGIQGYPGENLEPT